MEGDQTQLVEAARRGEREAYGLLVERHWSGLVRLARSVVGDLEAEDAVQDGLIVAWRQLAQLADSGCFSAWVTRIVFRRCLRRTSLLRRFVPLDAAPESSYAPDPAAGIAVWQVLSRLAPRQRAVLHLTVVEGMTDSEIADRLAIAAGSVRAHRRRARERVAAILKGGPP
jgi:RNA polymerase sigma-70 factor (ECF subfamily)